MNKKFVTFLIVPQRFGLFRNDGNPSTLIRIYLLDSELIFVRAHFDITLAYFSRALS
jgi:hypothetical protein